MGLARQLDADVAQALLETGDGWDISADDATFAFTAGFALQRRIFQAHSKDNMEVALQASIAGEDKQ